MGGQDVVGPTELAGESILGALFGVFLGDDAVALAVAPALARATLDDEFGLFVNLFADDALTEGLARSAKGIILKPLGVEAGVIGPAACAHGAPGRRE